MKMTRRQWLRLSAKLAGMGTPIFTFPGILRGQESPRRLIHIMMRGGWTTFWASDPPVTSGKSSSEGYADAFKNQKAVTVSGKSNLLVGEGFAPAANAFNSMNTAFVNGVDSLQVLHDVGRRYGYSGSLVFSNSRKAPCLSALLGNVSAGFPSHLVLGASAPLGTTVKTTPPLFADSGISSTVAPPYSGTVAQRISETIDALDDMHFETLSVAEKSDLEGWRAVKDQLAAFDAKDFATLMTPTSEELARYKSDSSSFLSTYLALKAGMTSYITLTVGWLDSHFDEGAQLSQQQEISGLLNILVDDLTKTKDPDDSTKMLAETTTIVINSEFGRTPTYNDKGGTDHWDVTSLILMGRGIRDNTVIGSTDAEGKAMGWDGSTTVTKTVDNALLLEHVFSPLLDSFGLTTQAKELSAKQLVDVFG